MGCTKVEPGSEKWQEAMELLRNAKWGSRHIEDDHVGDGLDLESVPAYVVPLIVAYRILGGMAIHDDDEVATRQAAQYVVSLVRDKLNEAVRESCK